MSDDLRHEKAQKHVRTWLTHCQHLSGDALSLRYGSGVCAEYALEKLLEMYDNDIKDADIREKAGLLLDLCKSHLSGTLGYEGASLQGLCEVLELGMKTFEKADRLDRSGSSDFSVIRRMYYSAWEFFGVVIHGMARRKGREGWSIPEWYSIEDVKGKSRYSMWRATEIWKAERENREPVAPPGLDDGQGFEEWLMSEESGSNGSRYCRNFFEGQKVLYSESGRSYSKTPGTVVRVQWNDTSHLVECDVRLDSDGNVVKKVRNEYLAPLINVGDIVCISGGSVKAKVEDVNDSMWPPRYLVLTVHQSLEEVEDEDVYFPERESEAKPVGEDVESTPHGGAHVTDISDDSSNVSSYVETSSYEEYSEQPLEKNNVVVTEEKPAESLPRDNVQTTQKDTTELYNDDIESLCKGEKLCKSALSAISFGDAPTAVKYLQQALETLQKM